MTPPSIQPLADACADFTSQWEGRIPWMYLDGPGNVTAGCGHKLDTPEEASTVFGCDVAAEFNAVKVSEPGHAAEWYETLTDSRLTDEQIKAILASDLQWFIGHSARMIGTWNTRPQPAQIACVDIAFNTGGLGGWPSLCKAVSAGDWATAARQSHRIETPAPGGVQTARNEATAALFSGLG